MREPIFLLKCLFTLFLLTFTSLAYGQIETDEDPVEFERRMREEWRHNGGKVQIKYVQYGKEKILDNNFSIFFVLFDSVQKTVIKPNIVQNTFIMPKELEGKESYVIFKYKSKMFYMYHPNISNRGKRWSFHFDKKPYRDEHYTYYNKHKHIFKKGTKGVYGFVCDELITTICITNFTKYFNDSHKLLDL